MLKHLALATVITLGASAAYGQAQTGSPSDQQAARPAATTQAPADVSKLIGRNVRNQQNETIGEIKSIHVDKDGSVNSVIVGVGGFLGMGEKEVRLAWKDLVIEGDGERVTVNMTKDEPKKMPEYKYRDQSWRGKVFTDTGPLAAGATASGDFNTQGQAAASDILGASVHNQNREKVGSVEEVWIGKDGAIKAIVVSVGDFIGVGGKNVAVKWSDVSIDRDGDDLIFKTTLTKDSLKSMPEYKAERAAR